MVEPRLRFHRDDGSNYPNWSEHSIADLFDKVTTKNKDGTNSNVITNSAEYGLIPQRDFFDKDIAVAGKTENYTVIDKGDFVYNPRKSSSAPMGPFNCYSYAERGIVSPLYSCLRPKGIANNDFLLWYFKTDKWFNYVETHGAQGGARHDRVGMTDKILMGIPVKLPCHEEQKRIADFLSSVDDVISACEKELEQAKELKRGMLQKMFPKKGETVPEVRFPGFTGDWEQRKLGDVVAVCSGRDYKHLSEGGIPVYGTGGYMLSVSEALSETEDAIGIGRKGTIDNPYILRAPFWTVDTLFYCIPKPGYDLDFVYGIYQNIKWRTMDESTGVPSLSKTAINAVDVMIPSKQEQMKIGGFFTNLDNTITLHQRELDKWKELKKGLLQQMFV